MRTAALNLFLFQLVAKATLFIYLFVTFHLIFIFYFSFNSLNTKQFFTLIHDNDMLISVLFDYYLYRITNNTIHN